MTDLREILSDIHSRSALIGGGFVDVEDYDWSMIEMLIRAKYLEAKTGKHHYRPTVEGMEALLKK